MYFENHREGISPLIASVMLMGFTLTVALLFSPWITDLVENMSKGVDEDVQKATSAAEADIEMKNVEYNSALDEVDVAFQNTGQGALEKFSFTVFCEGGKATSFEIEEKLDISQLTVEELPIEDCRPKKVRLDSTELPVTEEEEKFDRPSWSESHQEEPSDLGKIQDSMEGDGTSQNPYLITNDHELQAIKKDLNAHYRLEVNINASLTKKWNDGKGFQPIGGEIDKFNGTFEGNFHIIEGLYINRTNEDRVGLFGDNNRTIKELQLTNADVTGNNNVGILSGHGSRGDIERIYTSGAVKGENKIGGIAGKVKRYNPDVGNPRLAESGSDASVAGEERIGGVIGSTSRSQPRNLYSGGRVKGSRHVGGILGLASNGGRLTYALAYGNVTGKEEDYTGGVYGHQSTSTVNEHTLYWDVESTGQKDCYNDAGDGGCNPLTTSEAAGGSAEENMDELDFKDIWRTTNSYPGLQWDYEN